MSSRWMKRWFVLKNQNLYYYKSPDVRVSRLSETDYHSEMTVTEMVFFSKLPDFAKSAIGGSMKYPECCKA